LKLLKLNRLTQHRRRGFTLIEVLVSVALIALLLTILLPSLSRARKLAQSVKCLSNLRQMAVAGHTYAVSHHRFPPSLFSNADNSISYGWDLEVHKQWSASQPDHKVKPGLLWSGKTVDEINQCPSFEGSDNWVDYPFTGYNYNTSYVGYCRYKVEIEGWPPVPTGKLIAEVNPARPDDINRPAECALFGDGEYANGANKFMRSPFEGRDASFSGRSAGTQGYRHIMRTNVAFADGHAQSWNERYTDTYEFDELNVLPHDGVPTGFLSPDNSLYDLE
jgi:prepilin-type N-terminal cleavage/methylation domain-containing protein/prepilin-type processing-associated H-X9-DG protein